MKTKSSPYHPITPELAASGLLITIKQAAAEESACETTLKSNAKARRLAAYQAHFGAPVMVLPSEIQEFLKDRPDIASKYHPKRSPAVSAAGHSPAAVKPKTSDDFHFPDGDSRCSPIGDLGIGISVHSLNHCQPVEIGLVANTLMEVGRQLLELLPPQTKQRRTTTN